MTFVVSLNWLRRFVPMRMEKNYGSPPLWSGILKSPLMEKNTHFMGWRVSFFYFTDFTRTGAAFLRVFFPFNQFRPHRKWPWYGCFPFWSLSPAHQMTLTRVFFPFDQFRSHRKCHWYGCFLLLFSFTRTNRDIPTGVFLFWCFHPY